MLRLTLTGIMCLCWLMNASAGPIYIENLSGRGRLYSWNEFRNNKLVRQNYDFSCGAASLATILRFQYGVDINEDRLIHMMGAVGAISFADMHAVLPNFGLIGVGVAMNYDELLKIKTPAIIFLRYRGSDHFSTLRGIDPDRVWLADPSWGNRILSKSEFIAMWHTRADFSYPGKLMLILPKNGQIESNNPLTPPSRIRLKEVLLSRQFISPN